MFVLKVATTKILFIRYSFKNNQLRYTLWTLHSQLLCRIFFQLDSSFFAHVLWPRAWRISQSTHSITFVCPGGSSAPSILQRSSFPFLLRLADFVADPSFALSHDVSFNEYFCFSGGGVPFISSTKFTADDWLLVDVDYLYHLPTSFLTRTTGKHFLLLSYN